MLKPLAIIYERRDVYFNTDYWENYSSYKYSYENSQYVKKNNPQIIPDEIFESYAGGAFLKGLNPILITHDHPPLGRYIVSLSILFFNNQHTVVLVFFALSIFGIYLISKKVLSKNILALSPCVLLLNEPLFVDKLRYTPLPELFQLAFIIYAIFFFMKAIEGKKSFPFFLMSSLMLGGVIATRVFALGGVLAFSFTMYLFLFKRKMLLQFLVTLPLSLIVLVLSYTRTMVLGASVFDIFGIQKYILAYHRSKFIFPFSFWELLLLNRWHTWWDGNKILQDGNWRVTWPISFIFFSIMVIKGLVKKMNISSFEWVLFMWLGFYMTFLSVGYTSTRYFLPIIPFLYILALACMLKFFNNNTDEKKTSF